jgi:hypothetical protein
MADVIELIPEAGLLVVKPSTPATAAVATLSVPFLAWSARSAAFREKRLQRLPPVALAFAAGAASLALPDAEADGLVGAETCSSSRLRI